MEAPRHLVLVLGDQLDPESSAFDGFDAGRDAVWMAEAARETTAPPAHQRRIAFFFTAMRHLRDELRRRGIEVRYVEMPEAPRDDAGGTLGELLTQEIRDRRPERIIVTEPGDLRVRNELEDVAATAGLPIDVRVDRHFFETVDGFRAWAEGRKDLVLEHFYRRLRRAEGLLLDPAGEPEGGRWNHDEANRKAFGPRGPGTVPPVPRFDPDETTAGVLELVRRRFAHHPGTVDDFDLPVTRQDALAFLDAFVADRLPRFGDHEDAMWAGEPVLFHARLSALLNVKLLSPRTCVGRAVAAYRAGHAPINAVEGFVRQIVGWREFVRGVYWTFMPGYADGNALGCDPDRDVPSFFWTGETEMACVADAMEGVLRHGYAHHIQRLMVLGLLAQLLGVHPYRFHEWHMAMYLDAVDWVSLPNTLGMSQYGDGGVVGTKPYCATGRYVDRMSNYCRGCRYEPKRSVGPDACPLTTLYWDFLDRHADRFAGNHRMALQLRNLEKKQDDELVQIRRRARDLRDTVDEAGGI